LENEIDDVHASKSLKTFLTLCARSAVFVSLLAATIPAACPVAKAVPITRMLAWARCDAMKYSVRR
jgi:hypothetical protein